MPIDSKNLEKMNVLFAGCGFLASHLVHHLVPHTHHFVFVDRERIEEVNYDNYILPKGYVGRRKASAFSALVQLTSSSRTTPIHLNIRDSDHLAEICNEYAVDFIFTTFDNIEARLIAKECSEITKIPNLFAGVTEGFVYIDWSDKVMLPSNREDIERVEAELNRIRDVCTRLEFRILGVLASGYAYFSFLKFINEGKRFMHQISVDQTIQSTSLRRG